MSEIKDVVEGLADSIARARGCDAEWCRRKPHLRCFCKTAAHASFNHLIRVGQGKMDEATGGSLLREQWRDFVENLRSLRESSGKEGK
jgi:hypothetical protein